MTTITLELNSTVATLQDGDARIIDWKEDEQSKVPIKEVPTKTTPTVETEIWSAKPKIITVKCRITDGEKDDLDTIQENEDDTDQPLLKEDGATLNTVWIESVSYVWQGDQNWVVPWIATIKMRVIS